MRDRTLPCEPIASMNLATMSALVGQYRQKIIFAGRQINLRDLDFRFSLQAPERFGCA
jgi:hypothetical protein